MRSEDYTDDAICSAMGLERFEPPRYAKAIRLLLKPSFHPEVCITLEPTRVQIVSLHTMLWHEPGPCRMAEIAETFASTEPQFEATVEAFRKAVADHLVKREMVWLDGMSVTALLNNVGSRLLFAGHPDSDAEGAFVVSVLRLAHDSLSSPLLRNRIAQCGEYIGLELAIEPEPQRQDTTRIMVLGTPQERADYLEMLRRDMSGRLQAGQSETTPPPDAP